MSKYFNVFCLPNKQVNKYKTKIHIIYMLCPRAPCVPRPQWSPRNLNFVRPGTRSKELFVSFERSGEIITHSWRTLIQDRYKSNHALKAAGSSDNVLTFPWFHLLADILCACMCVCVCVHVCMCDFAGQCESIFLGSSELQWGEAGATYLGKIITAEGGG